jgi:hypothetical protein
MLDPLGQGPQYQSLGAGRGLRARRAIGQSSGHDRHLGQPATVQFLLDLDRQHGCDRQGPAPW